MKKKAFKMVVMVVIVIGILFLGSGFMKRTDVFLGEYSVSEDSSRLSMNVGIGSSMGFTRGYKIKKGNNSEYIIFYSTFGGFNSSIGAKNEFEIKLDSSCTKIYFYNGAKSYRQILQKNKVTSEWERVK